MKWLFLLLASIYLTGCGCSVVDPGNRGVKVSLGEVSPAALPEGLVWHAPMITTIHEVSIRQQTGKLKAECYSSDLQQVTLDVKVLYRLPEGNVVAMYQKYQGDPFEALIEPRVQEAFKEVAALQTAENIIKKNEQIKQDVFKLAKIKIGELVYIEDVVVSNQTLSKELEAAIESKMVQQQEAAKAEFIKAKAAVEAETALIKAEGEAKAIRTRGAAIKENPGLIDLQIVEHWDGHTPTTVVLGSGGSTTNILLPHGKESK